MTDEIYLNLLNKKISQFNTILDLTSQIRNILLAGWSPNSVLQTLDNFEHEAKAELATLVKDKETVNG